MLEFTSNLQKETESQLLSIEKEAASMKERAERSIRFVQLQLAQLRNFITGYTFKNKGEEILFYKDISPSMYCLLIYFQRIFLIESSRTPICIQLQCSAIESELKEVSHFFEMNTEFFNYYNSAATYLDLRYFTQEKDGQQIILDDYSMAIDREFCTVHSCKVARIKAYRLLEPYLHDCLQSCNAQLSTINFQNVAKLCWTSSKPL
jgi:hypothetical protein